MRTATRSRSPTPAIRPALSAAAQAARLASRRGRGSCATRPRTRIRSGIRTRARARRGARPGPRSRSPARSGARPGVRSGVRTHAPRLHLCHLRLRLHAPQDHDLPPPGHDRLPAALRRDLLPPRRRPAPPGPAPAVRRRRLDPGQEVDGQGTHRRRRRRPAPQPGLHPPRRQPLETPLTPARHRRPPGYSWAPRRASPTGTGRSAGPRAAPGSQRTGRK
ncbi:hypothetical protein AF335_14260 [Streptomyces eurocidicus]|uniref:Uncharacterized protein n=1 Tax=Streptomyces eurocidicus TaxID=66423 RepID=A0A2N8NVB4_STREU|nr:hypothetical protein AF335_14260 [Streptomyces eurocidicus]